MIFFKKTPKILVRLKVLKQDKGTVRLEGV